MPQFVVRSKHALCHALFLLFDHLLGHDARGITVITLRLGHDLECIVLMPRRTRVEYAPCAQHLDVVQLLVKQLCLLTLGSRCSVLDIYDVIRKDKVVVLTGYR